MATAPGTPMTPLWQIESQVETSSLDVNGRAVKGMTIGFVTVSGKHGTVFIPDAQLTEANVRALVAHRAQLLEAIGSLSG